MEIELSGPIGYVSYLANWKAFFGEIEVKL
jgi:hypothetical protein